MPRDAERIDLNEDAQRLFYESSKEWVLSLKARYDPGDLLQVLENDTDRYPYQRIDAALVPAYQPSQDEIREAGGKKEIESRILAEIAKDSDEVMGEGRFDSFVSDLIESSDGSGRPGSALRNIWARLQISRNNVSAVAYHPNILALPIYSGGIASAFSKAEFLDGKFDLFEFNSQNLLIANPALAVAAYKGVPVMERLSKVATVIQTIPPTRSGLEFYNDRPARRAQSAAARTAMASFLDGLYEKKRSAYLTIDPTGSTAEPVIEDGRLAALKRRPVNRVAKLMIMNDFHFTWPMTMFFSKSNGASWNVGKVNPIFTEAQFNEMIDGLDEETGKLAGVPLISGSVEKSIGRAAI